ncbi:MAG: hypothetical protein ACJA2Q_002785 [Pseudohongiellaceae bacterium]|jgi:hypothetical protein
MKYFRNIKTAFLAVGFLSCVSPSNANEFYLLNLSLGEESNVPRGIDDFHERESTFVRAGVTAGKRIQLGINDSLTFTGNLSYRRFDELRGFDRIELGVGAGYRYKFGFGPFAPTANASVNYNVENGAGQARDTEAAQIEFSVGKRFQSGFTLGVGIDYQRNATNDLANDPAVDALDYDPLNTLPNELFDFESISAFFAADYEFASGWRTSLNYRRINGFTVASTTQPSLKIYKISDAFYSDPAFSTSNSAMPWFGYLLETNSDQWEGALSIPLSMDTSIDFSVNWTDISAPERGNYQNTIFAITFIHSL